MILAIPLLGEKVTAAGWVAAITGFCGVLLVARPGSGLDTLRRSLCAGLCCRYGRLLSPVASACQNRKHDGDVVSYRACRCGAVRALFAMVVSGADAARFDLVLFVAIGLRPRSAIICSLPRSGCARVGSCAGQLSASFLGGIVGWLAFDHVPSQTSFIGIGAGGASPVWHTAFLKPQTACIGG